MCLLRELVLARDDIAVEVRATEDYSAVESNVVAALTCWSLEHSNLFDIKLVSVDSFHLPTPPKTKMASRMGNYLDC